MSSPFAAPYVPPAPGAYAPPTAQRRGPGLGITAMVVALIAVVVAALGPILFVGAAAVFVQAGMGAGSGIGG